ncbi:MAG: ABC transporter, partial [Epulopiscium sp. Nele67-Bin005]
MLVNIYNAKKQFGDFLAIDNINITINKGEIHGVIGENGAGKTTLIKSLVGIYELDSGTIEVLGEPVYENKLVKQKIGYVADQNQYFKNYKLEDLVRFYEDTYPTFSREKFNQYNTYSPLKLNKKVYQLSKGMQMRLALMLNLSIFPEFIVLDEPTSGLDAIAKKEILGWIIAEVEEREMSVLISSHHLMELEKICDTISMIHQGKITYQTTVDGLKEQIRKVQVVFSGEVPDLQKWSEVLEVSNIGSVYYIVTNKFDDIFVNKLSTCGVKLLEIIPLTL